MIETAEVKLYLNFWCFSLFVVRRKQAVVILSGHTWKCVNKISVKNIWFTSGLPLWWWTSCEMTVGTQLDADSFTDVSFVIVLCAENAFHITGESFATIPLGSDHWEHVSVLWTWAVFWAVEVLWVLLQCFYLLVSLSTTRQLTECLRQ